MKKAITLLTVLFFSGCAFAQDNSDIAIALYQKADDAYNIADYETALTSLKRAEQTLGSTNTKILYLKIKTLNMLAKVDGKSAADLQLSLATFFKLADKATYPQNKYSEMVIIKVDIMQKMQEEEDAYLKVKNSTIIADYNAFFDKYPNSKYDQELKSTYLKLKNQATIDAKQEWLKTNAPKWQSYKKIPPNPRTNNLSKKIETEAATYGYTKVDLKQYRK